MAEGCYYSIKTNLLPVFVVFGDKLKIYLDMRVDLGHHVLRYPVRSVHRMLAPHVLWDDGTRLIRPRIQIEILDLLATNIQDGDERLKAHAVVAVA